MVEIKKVKEIWLRCVAGDPVISLVGFRILDEHYHGDCEKEYKQISWLLHQITAL